MKKALFLVLFIAGGCIASAQVSQPTKWHNGRPVTKHKTVRVNPTAKTTETFGSARSGTYGLIAESPEILLSPNWVIPGTVTQVPDNVMTRIKTKYGPSLYDVKAIIDLTDQIVYIVRVVDKGNITQEYLDEYANPIVSPYLK
jgi:hypothetical protein